jgi:hypothetical protein
MSAIRGVWGIFGVDADDERVRKVGSFEEEASWLQDFGPRYFRKMTIKLAEAKGKSARAGC